MRIIDLIEGKNFKDLEFVKHSGDKREINFDLAEDLVYFMNNDDDIYRRNLYPAIMRCQDRIDLKQPTNPTLFKTAVLDSYNHYCKKFPIRELPGSLDEEVCNEICKKLHEEICTQIKEGKYKE